MEQLDEVTDRRGGSASPSNSFAGPRRGSRSSASEGSAYVPELPHEEDDTHSSSQSEASVAHPKSPINDEPDNPPPSVAPRTTTESAGTAAGSRLRNRRPRRTGNFIGHEILGSMLRPRIRYMPMSWLREFDSTSSPAPYESRSRRNLPPEFFPGCDGTIGGVVAAAYALMERVRRRSPSAEQEYARLLSALEGTGGHGVGSPPSREQQPEAEGTAVQDDHATTQSPNSVDFLLKSLEPGNSTDAFSVISEQSTTYPESYRENQECPTDSSDIDRPDSAVAFTTETRPTPIIYVPPRRNERDNEQLQDIPGFEMLHYRESHRDCQKTVSYSIYGDMVLVAQPAQWWATLRKWASFSLPDWSEESANLEVDVDVDLMERCEFLTTVIKVKGSLGYDDRVARVLKAMQVDVENTDRWWDDTRLERTRFCYHWLSLYGDTNDLTSILGISEDWQIEEGDGPLLRRVA